MDLFRNLKRKISDSGELIKILKDEGSYALSCFREEIESGGHGSFAPLSMRTVLEKIGLGVSPWPILVRFGDLEASLNEGHYNNIFDVALGDDVHEVTVGTMDPVAPLHQYGSPDTNLPARPFVLLTKDERDELSSMCARWLGGD
jgi:hypothetical protein